MKNTLIAVTAIALAGAFAPAVAGDAAAGKAKYAVCAGCHGPTGAGNEALKYPKLAGLGADHVKQQLAAFKQRDLKSPQYQVVSQGGPGAPAADDNDVFHINKCLK